MSSLLLKTEAPIIFPDLVRFTVYISGFGEVYCLARNMRNNQCFKLQT